MADEFHDPVWACAKKGAKIGGWLGCFLGFVMPWGALVLALTFFEDAEIGALIPFDPIVLAPLGLVCFGLSGLIIGWLWGRLKPRQVAAEETSLRL